MGPHYSLLKKEYEYKHNCFCDLFLKHELEDKKEAIFVEVKINPKSSRDIMMELDRLLDHNNKWPDVNTRITAIMATKEVFKSNNHLINYLKKNSDIRVYLIDINNKIIKVTHIEDIRILNAFIGFKINKKGID